MDGQIASVVKGVFCAVSRIDDHYFACAVDGLDSALDRTCNILNRESSGGAQQQEADNRILHCELSSNLIALSRTGTRTVYMNHRNDSPSQTKCVLLHAKPCTSTCCPKWRTYTLRK